MVVVGGPRAEQAQDFGICRNDWMLHIFGEVFVDLVPEGYPNPPGGCPKPFFFFDFDLWGPPYKEHRAL